MSRRPLAVAILASLALVACGGGGGSVRSDPPAAGAAVATPKPRYGGLQDNIRVPGNLDQAQALGFDGTGVKVGLMDEARLDFAALEGQVSWYQDVLLDPSSPVHPGDTRNGHGTVVASVIAGRPTGEFSGGGAPGAKLYWARICADGNCNPEMSALAAKALAERGARIVNLSFGAGSATEAERRQAAQWWAHALAPLLSSDALLVASTGNAKAADAGYPAATPQYVPETAEQFIAVAAVEVDATGQPAGLAAYSNRCGAAARWCLVAPGSVQVANAPATQAVVSGTSVAAPIVTATAALVAQAFPWMSAANLQQTLISTATDLGSPGVDSTYGWGLVNAAKAVKGPGWFDRDFVADVRGDAVFDNDIGGSGGLVKQGPGSLVLRGQGRYSGMTDIRAGTLGVQGNLAGSVSVRAGATLQAMGGRIAGDYRADSGATTAIAPGAALSVGGTAFLDGTLLLQPEASGYQVSGSETLLTAAQVEGRFTSVALANGFFYTPILAYEDRRVVASLSRNVITLAAVEADLPAAVVDGARQADALVGVLDAQAGSTTAIPSPVLASATSLMAASDAQVQASLASFAAPLHGGERAATVLSAEQAQAWQADRLAGVPGDGVPAMWLHAGLVDGALRRDGYARTDYRDDGAAVGFDLPIGHGALFGAALSAGQRDVDVDGDHARVPHQGIDLYLRQPLGGTYLMAQLGGSRDRVEATRNLYVADRMERVSSRRHDEWLGARLEFGLWPGTRLTPFVAGGLLRQQQGAFNEDAASGMGLAARADTARLHYFEIGQRARMQRGRWHVDGVVACRHQGGDALDFSATFSGLPQAGFEVRGAALPRDTCRATGSASLALDTGMTLRAGIGVQRGSGQSSQHQADLDLTWRF